MLLWRERSIEPRLWFAWRPVYARAANGKDAGWVWLEQVVADYVEGTWGGGGGWFFTRVPMPTGFTGGGFGSRGVGRALDAGLKRACEERDAKQEQAEAHRHY